MAMLRAKILPSRRVVSSVLLAVGLALISAVACGAAGTKSKTGGKSRAPLKPLSYDPRVSLAPLVDRVAPAVVNIRTKTRLRQLEGLSEPESLFEWFFGPRSPGRPPFRRPERGPLLQSMGSGFIIDPGGLVVTNHHVIKDADQIEVQVTDERTFEAELLGSDERTDLALLKLKDAKNLPAVDFGSSGSLRVGDHVVAIGNPFGLDHTVTSGIVSAKERVIGAGPYDDFIQTDASINPGNSGGPLFNLRGEVVGINTAIAPRGQGIGFAIPSDLARGLIDSLRREGRVVRGWLGITFQPMNEDLARAFGPKSKDGAVVANVSPGSPAEKGGIETGDVIVKVNGVRLESGRQLPTLVAGLQPNKTVPIDVIRDGKPKTLRVTIGEMPGNAGGVAAPGPGRKGEQSATELGIQIRPLEKSEIDRLKSEGVEHGVVVERVKPGSSASGLLLPRDIIVEVNRQPAKDVKAFRDAIKSMRPGASLLLRIFRNGSWIYLVIRV